MVTGLSSMATSSRSIGVRVGCGHLRSESAAVGRKGPLTINATENLTVKITHDCLMQQTPQVQERQLPRSARRYSIFARISARRRSGALVPLA